MAAVRHLGFSKVGTFNCPYPSGAKMRHHAKYCADRSNRCGDMAFFNFSRWRPSAILDLLYACLDHPRSYLYFGGHCHCAKFGLNRCSSFDNMQVLIFWALSLKMLTFFGCFWGKNGETETCCIFIPLGMPLTQKHAFWGITCQNRPSGLTPSCAKETIKKIK